MQRVASIKNIAVSLIRSAGQIPRLADIRLVSGAIAVLRIRHALDPQEAAERFLERIGGLNTLSVALRLGTREVPINPLRAELKRRVAGFASSSDVHAAERYYLATDLPPAVRRVKRLSRIVRKAAVALHQAKTRRRAAADRVLDKANKSNERIRLARALERSIQRAAARIMEREARREVRSVEKREAYIAKREAKCALARMVYHAACKERLAKHTITPLI